MDELERILDMEKNSKERRDAVVEYARDNNLEIEDVLKDLIIAQADRENKNENIKLKRPITFDE